MRHFIFISSGPSSSISSRKFLKQIPVKTISSGCLNQWLRLKSNFPLALLSMMKAKKEDVAPANNPHRLRDLCMSLVARHMSWVDSLEGFPSVIGHELWRSYLEFDGGKRHLNNVKSSAGLQSLINLQFYLSSFSHQFLLWINAGHINIDLQRVICIFADAYGPEFLSKANLRNRSGR